MKSFFLKQYHWVIAAVMLLQMAIYGGLFNNFNALFLLPVTEELHISRSAFSLVMGLRPFVAFVFLLFSGILHKRFGSRTLMIASLSIAVVANIILSVSNGIPAMVVGAAAIGVADGFCGSPGVNLVIRDWFQKRRGTVLGVVSSFAGIGGSVCCLLLSSIMGEMGWRWGYGLSAILIAGILLLNFLFVRDTPETMGLQPYSNSLQDSESQKKETIQEDFPGEVFQRQLKKPRFYIILVVMLITYIVIYLPNSIIIPHMTDQGLTEEQAVLLQSIMLLALSVSKVICGLSMDQIGVKATTILCLLSGGISMCLLPQISGFGVAVLAVVLYAASLPITAITIPNLTMELFGYRSYDTVFGILSSTVYIGMMLGTPLSNGVYDLFSSYQPAFRFGGLAFFALIVFYLLIFLRSSRKKEQKI